jgi:hypothetical protein
VFGSFSEEFHTESELYTRENRDSNVENLSDRNYDENSESGREGQCLWATEENDDNNHGEDDFYHVSEDEIENRRDPSLNETEISEEASHTLSETGSETPSEPDTDDEMAEEFRDALRNLAERVENLQGIAGEQGSQKPPIYYGRAHENIRLIH